MFWVVKTPIIACRSSMLWLGRCPYPDLGSSHEELSINIRFHGVEGRLTFRK